jgi:hypothetical protein
MRSLELGKAAAAAEKLRLAALTKRQAMRGAYGGAATIFLVGIIGWASVLSFLAIAMALGPLWSAAILLTINVVIFGALLLPVIRSRPGKVEIEAAQVRDDAMATAKRYLAVSALVGPVGRLAGRSAFRLARTAIAAPFRDSKPRR